MSVLLKSGLFAVGIVAIASIAVAVSAQTPASPAFEVASIKPGNADEVESEVVKGRQFIATNLSLRDLVSVAFQIPWHRLVSVPSWFSDRFDVIANIPENADLDTVSPMLRELLAERFKLVVHAETREQPIYALIVERSDGRVGPQLHTSSIDCAAVEAAARPGDQTACRNSMTGNSLQLRGMDLGALANRLAVPLSRVVIDQTGLSGNFDAELQWNAETGPSLFTALEEQLGLKLDARKGPVNVLVIDHAEKLVPD